MRYFEVRKEVLDGMTRQYNVCIDGEPAGTSESEMEARSMTTGFNVWEYDEDGMTTDVKFYAVKTDTEAWEDNEQEVLNKIIEDHRPEDGWQNNEW